MLNADVKAAVHIEGLSRREAALGEDRDTPLHADTKIVVGGAERKPRLVEGRIVFVEGEGHLLKVGGAGHESRQIVPDFLLKESARARVIDLSVVNFDALVAEDTPIRVEGIEPV